MKLLGILEKLRNFQGVGGGGYDNHPLEWKFQEVGV